MERTRIEVPSSSSSLIEPKQAKAYKRFGIATTKMLQTRELNGNITTSAKGKYNFREEYTKTLVSEPMIWRYNDSGRRFDSPLEQVDIIANTPDGEFRTDLLVSAALGSFLSFYVVDKDTQEFNYGVRSTPDCAWPLNIKNKDGFAKSPGHLWTLDGALVDISSSISCIKKFGTPGHHKILVTSFDNYTNDGSVYVLGLSDPLVLRSRFPKIVENLDCIYSVGCSIWTADCNSKGSRALIGTKLGAGLLNVETGALSWVCFCKSNISSVQLDYTEKVALCGLQNGAIVSVDIRQTPDRQQILPHYPETGFELYGRIFPSGTISTPSSISCLTSLKHSEQYFLASSMDGSTKLYDHRMLQRGAVISYQGTVSLNGNRCGQHAVDHSEKYVMSGGVDGKVRIWSIKSGDLLFEEMFMSSSLYKFCWAEKEDNYASIYNEHSIFGEAWIGAPCGLYHMRW